MAKTLEVTVEFECSECGSIIDVGGLFENRGDYLVMVIPCSECLADAEKRGAEIESRTLDY